MTGIRIDVVDDRSKNLILSVAPFAGEDYNTHELLESVARISDNQPNEAYEIWRRLLDGTSSDFPEEAIRTALINLVCVGPDGLRKAKDIVSIYLKNGVEGPSVWFQEMIGEANRV